jgi:tetratricopeptide (TPR) repeat protein
MMHPVRTFAAISIALALGSGCSSDEQPSAAAAAPPDACSVALAAGTEQTDRDRDIAQAQRASREAQHAREALERLGYLYVARARVSNDPGDYKLAEATAACLDSRYPGEAATQLLRGHVLHQLHRFREAEQIARALVARRTVVLDYGLLGDALMEQGRLAEAADAYQRMLDLKPFYQSYTRAAHLRWLKGDVDGADTAMRLAIDSASPRDPESSAWAWTRLSAYHLQAARLDEASTAAENALRHQPGYAAALLAQGRALLAMHRSPEAVEVLQRAARLNPLPEYQWVLAEALREDGRAGEADTVENELRKRGGALDPRTLALFLATRRLEPATALALTEQELQTRADVFTLDAHAWALAAAGRIDTAHEVMARALAEGTQDARLFLHAGVIHARAGRDREARRWLGRAAGLKAMLLPSESAELARQLTTMQ